MHIHTHADAGPLYVRVNPGNGSPFALIDLGHGGDLVLENLDERDQLIEAATAARWRLENATSGEPHPYARQEQDSYDGYCDVCGLLPSHGIHEAPAQDESGIVTVDECIDRLRRGDS